VSGKQLSLFPETSKASAELTVLRDLDRSEVEPLAFKILTEIESFCVRAEIAGSLRRQRGSINDIDIVVQPRPEPDSWLNILKTVKREFDATTEKQGDKLATLYVPFASIKGHGHIQVDLYRATAATWGILLLVRTGSKEHNVHLCNVAISKGFRLFYSQGFVDKNNNVIAGRTEEEVFQALGMPFVIPQDREIKEPAT
jgi:DNA polymerase (family 10)